MSLAGNSDGTGVRKVQALTMDDVCYENPNEHVRQRLLCRSVILSLEVVLSPPKPLLRQSSAAGVQPT